MPLTPGTRLGAYAIVSPVGAGGMGEVYRARDMKLNRDVAIKVLPADVSGRADALSHSNILAIHDFGSESVWCVTRPRR